MKIGINSLKIFSRSSLHSKTLPSFHSFQFSRSFNSINHSDSINSSFHDIVIVGGGLVGASLACALSSTPITQHLKIAIIDNEGIQSHFSSLPEYPDLRVSAINESSKNLFQAIGCWDKIEKSGRIAPYYQMKVWDTHEIDFSSRESGTLGFIIENKVMLSAIHEKLTELSNNSNFNLTLFNKQSIESIGTKAVDLDSPNPDWVKVTLKNKQVLETRLLIGADGASSLVRQYSSIPTKGYSYHQSGLVCSVKHANPNRIAWQRFLPSGPIALLPMFGNYSSIVWSTSPVHAKTLIHLPPETFVSEVNRAFTGSNYQDRNVTSVPPILEVMGPRASFPLRFLLALHYVKNRIALVGDAAHVIHPLAGQGVNLGFADAISLATTIVQGVETGQDIGSLSLLQQYEKSRSTTNLTMMTGIESIKRIFDSTFCGAVWARNVGFLIVNSIPPLKQLFIQQATGETLDLSKIGNPTK